MARWDFENYISEIASSLSLCDGERSAKLIGCVPKIPYVRDIFERTSRECSNRGVASPFDEVVAFRVEASRFEESADNERALEFYCNSLNSLVSAFSEMPDENWPLPILYKMCLLTRLSARKINTSKAFEKAAESIMACFRVCTSDTRSSPATSKKWGMLYLVNQLFKVYFAISALHLCKPLIRAIENLRDVKEDQFPLAQRVTYRYFVGRKAMFDSELRVADSNLSFAFEHCIKSSSKNKRKILIYLVPVRMLLGRLPQQRLLIKYNLAEFGDVARAVSAGNLLQLDNALAKHEHFFIQCGVYLLLEKLRPMVYRTLFKRVQRIMNTFQIPIGALTTALVAMNVEDADDDETSCILANLIHDGKVKGYLSYSHQKLVISKQNAFPPFASS